MSGAGSSPSSRDNVLPFARPQPTPPPKIPEHLLLTTETSLRATDAYVRLLHGRLEHARRARSGRDLGRSEASALHRVVAASDALQRACGNALGQIDQQLATRAHLVAQAAAELVPGGCR